MMMDGWERYAPCLMRHLARLYTAFQIPHGRDYVSATSKWTVFCPVDHLRLLRMYVPWQVQIAKGWERDKT